MKEPNFQKEPASPKFLHVVDLAGQHEEGSHKHHSKICKDHAAGHKAHHEHVKAMCGGGMTGKR
jgi:hypothetical protein